MHLPFLPIKFNSNNLLFTFYQRWKCTKFIDCQLMFIFFFHFFGVLVQMRNRLQLLCRICAVIKWNKSYFIVIQANEMPKQFHSGCKKNYANKLHQRTTFFMLLLFEIWCCRSIHFYIVIITNDFCQWLLWVQAIWFSFKSERSLTCCANFVGIIVVWNEI